ncbi:MAG: TIGR00266 family protein [Planctomycetaceae bacterium]|nr:TIGR00266 family protein [Planctomycetaceae bacterium]
MDGTSRAGEQGWTRVAGETIDMQFDIGGNPEYGDLTVTLDSGESIWTEAGAMSRMSSHLQLATRLPGGFVQSAIRKLVGGESLFISEYTAESPGTISISPASPGCVLERELRGDSLWLTAGAFLACTPGLSLDPRFGGLRSFFSGEGVVLMEASGEGSLFFNAFGGVVEKSVEGSLIVDTGHVVGWEPTLEYRIKGMGGLKQTLFSGEGLVMEFMGRGNVWLQTRHVAAVAGWLTPYCSG